MNGDFMVLGIREEGALPPSHHSSGLISETQTESHIIPWSVRMPYSPSGKPHQIYQLKPGSTKAHGLGSYEVTNVTLCLS